MYLTKVKESDCDIRLSYDWNDWNFIINKNTQKIIKR